MKYSKGLLWGFCVTGCVTVAAHLAFLSNGRYGTGIDDANIFFSYAENFAAGRGMTYAAHHERVEGFTSMLWMLICSVSFKLGLREVGVRFLSILLCILTALLAVHMLYHAHSPKSRHVHTGGLFLVLVLASPAYFTWMTVTLMDTVLWGFLLMWMAYPLIVSPQTKFARLIFGVPFGLAPLARPEALLVAPVFLLLYIMRQLDALRLLEAIQRTMLAIVSFVLAASGLVAFRLWYFGYPFPNTYYAKVSPSLVYNLREGIAYFSRYLLSSSLHTALVLASVSVVILWAGKCFDRLMAAKSWKVVCRTCLGSTDALALASCVLLIVPILTGGDHFRMFRFYQPVYPLLVMVAVLVLAQRNVLGIFRRFINMPVRVGVCLVLSVLLLYWLVAWSSEMSWVAMRRGSPLEGEFRLVAQGQAEGHALNELFRGFDKLPSVGVITAGGIARTYAGRVVDLLGLNHPLIAHYKGDRKGAKNHAAFEVDAFFLVQPEIVLFDPQSPIRVFMKGLDQTPAFIEKWRYGTLVRGDFEVHAFVHRSVIECVEKVGGFFFRETKKWEDGMWRPVSLL